MHVLVVDDEVSICTCISEFLREEGFDVAEAHDGDTALVLASQLGASVSAVLTDIDMPRMNGIEMWHRMKPLVPNSRVLFMSGLLHDELGGYSLDGELLQKPFPFTTLAERLSLVIKQCP